MSRCLWFLTIATVFAIGCGSASPTSPSEIVSNSYMGRWVGHTMTGEPVSFSVSLSNRITDISFGFSSGPCKGSYAAAGLTLEITGMSISDLTLVGTPPRWVATNTVWQARFDYSVPAPSEALFISGTFHSNTWADGHIVLLDRGCDRVTTNWTASKQ